MASGTGTYPLPRVRRAAETKRHAEQEYREAITAAADLGIPYVHLAEVLGVTRQTVRVLVQRERVRQSSK